MSKNLFTQVIENINNSLKLVPGIRKLSEKSIISKIDDETIRAKGIDFNIDKYGNYIFNIYIILIQSTNILDVVQKAQKKLQYDLSLVDFFMDKSFILNFYVEDIY